MTSLWQSYNMLFENRIPAPELTNLVGSIAGTVFPHENPRIELSPRVANLEKRDDWTRRIVFNTIFTAGFSDPDAINAAAEHGFDSGECRAAFARHYRAFIVFVAYPTPAVDFSNHIMSALIVLTDTLHIEQVQSKRDGKAGGRGLIYALLIHLKPWARAHGIRFIRTTATSDRSSQLFLQNGFIEVKPHFAQDTDRYQRHLVYELPPPA